MCNRNQLVVINESIYLVGINLRNTFYGDKEKTTTTVLQETSHAKLNNGNRSSLQIWHGLTLHRRWCT